jgi:hypothetical protein
MGRGMQGARATAAAWALLGATGAGAELPPAAPQPHPTGVRLSFGIGVEGYDGEVGAAYVVGPLASLAVALQPLPALGVELGYTLGLHQVETDGDGGLVDGYDVVRHGLQSLLTLGPQLRGVRPYVLAGVGLGWTNVRGPDNPTYRDDRDGFVPLGAGLSVSSGRLTLDARLSYQWVFAQDSVVAPDGAGGASGGRYQALVSLGFML